MSTGPLSEREAAGSASSQPSGELVKLTGVVTRVIYHAEDSGYTVCAVAPQGGGSEATVVGHCPVVHAGETLSAEGRWVRHKQHGAQFQAERILCYPPATVEGIERYLAAGTIKGVGRVMAHRLVRKFGARTLEVIERESKRLEEVEGIGPTRRQQIKEAWKAQQDLREIMLFLLSHGVGTAHATRILRQYGGDAIARVREDPYRLCREVWGIGFKTADRIAMQLGIAPESEIRARAGVVYLLDVLAEEGHCYCPREDLLPAAERLLGIGAERLEAAIEHGIRSGEIIEEQGNLFPARLHQAETGVVAELARLARPAAGGRAEDGQTLLPWAERRMGLAFAPQQRAALAMALTHKVALITGGPGVGKTTLIRALVDIAARHGQRVCLAAPTGRAAKRIEEATGHEAQTLHRLLKYNPRTGTFEHGPQHRLEGDLFILDEVSMVDIVLMHTVLRALPTAARLLLVGDADQLPSVGPGNVLRDLLACGVLPVTRLDTVFRQAAESWIVRNAHRVNHGEPLELPPPGAAADFFFIPAATPDEAIGTTIELLTRRIPNRFGFRPRSDIQVLTPMRKYQLGSENLNAALQAALNPGPVLVQRHERIFKSGDRVMQIRNNYDKEVFNGDIGLVRAYEAEEQQLAVDMDGRVVCYAADELDELELAYACSVHKSQGSEYPAVVLLITPQHYKLLQRNLLYTAITRGRKLVCLVGSRRAVELAIRNDRVAERRTLLAARLRSALQG